MSNHKNKCWLLVIVCCLAILGLCFVGPIPQDPGYHQFADTRQIAGIDNFWDVVSNLPFLMAGVFGLWRYPRLTVAESKVGYLVLCVGVLLVAAGSSYYHLTPSNATLLWDRLPMTVAFMALLALLLGERVTSKHKNITLWTLVAFGVCAALYWSWTESQERGDLRPYVLVQFLPIILMPLILWLFPEKYIRSSLLMYAFVFYLLAKVCEHFDHEIYSMIHCVSGHSIKHITAALAVVCIIAAFPASNKQSGTQ